MKYTFREPYILLKQYTSKQGFGNGHPAAKTPIREAFKKTRPKVYRCDIRSAAIALINDYI